MLEKKSEHARHKNELLELIKLWEGYFGGSDTIKLYMHPQLNNPKDIQDALNYALSYNRKEPVIYFLETHKTANLYLSKELFYIYMRKHTDKLRRGHRPNRTNSDQEIHSFDKILAKLDLMNQNIEDLKSRSEEKAVEEAQLLLSELQIELINFLDEDFNEENIAKFKKNCLKVINKALESTLVKHGGWEKFLHSLVMLFTRGTFSPKTESQKLIEDTEKALNEWTNPNPPEAKSIAHAVKLSQQRITQGKDARARQTFRREALTAIQAGDMHSLASVISRGTCVIGERAIDHSPEDFQDFLNCALAYGRIEIVTNLMQGDYYPLIRQHPILIPKELFYVYALGSLQLSDEEIHGFDKIFDVLNIIHHKVIEWKSPNFPWVNHDNSIRDAMHILYTIQTEMIKVAHGEVPIGQFTRKCMPLLTPPKQSTAEELGDVLQRLKLALFGHSNLGPNRFSFYSLKSIICKTNEALHHVNSVVPVPKLDFGQTAI